MVSTRGPRYAFSEGEKVLCYEPDPTKAKVLYDSKVLEIHEAKDKRGRRMVEYLIHFQGWNPSWDRRVCENFILRDTPENRQLQQDLAEKSQLQIGAYLYRKDRRKRNSKGIESKHEEKTQRKDDLDVLHEPEEYYSSSAESVPDEDKVILRLSEPLKEILEQDFSLIKAKSRLTILPPKISVLSVLESFVKHSAIKQICGTLKRDKFKRRNSQTNKEPLDPEKYTNALNICKEVADGLRIYFNFTVRDHLLYDPERDQCDQFLNPNYLATFKHTPSEKNLYLDNVSLKRDGLENIEMSADALTDSGRRRLRSYRTEDAELALILDSGLSGSESCHSGISNVNANPANEFLKSVLPLNATIPIKIRMVLHSTLVWELLPHNAPAEPSMIYGPIHLARLLMKLPEFLTATNIAEEKLRLILRHLDDFLEYLEEHREWFGEEYYYEKGRPNE